jgi:hypothetical protein
MKLGIAKNNQYAYACSVDLAVGSGEWISEQELNAIDFNNQGKHPKK